MKLILLRLLRKFNFLKNRSLQLELRLNDVTFTVPIKNEIGFNNHNMDELWMLDLFQKFSETGKLSLVDVGANVGQTLLKWKACFPKAHYLGIEPNVICINYLKSLQSLNQFENTHFVAKALSNNDLTTNLHFHYNDPTDRTASISKIGLHSLRSVEVPSISWQMLSDQYNLNKTPLIIKLDCEGKEYEILEDMQPSIAAYNPIIIFEFIEIFDHQNNRQNLNQLIESLGFQLFQIQKKHKRLSVPSKNNAY